MKLPAMRERADMLRGTLCAATLEPPSVKRDDRKPTILDTSAPPATSCDQQALLWQPERALKRTKVRLSVASDIFGRLFGLWAAMPRLIGF